MTAQRICGIEELELNKAYRVELGGIAIAVVKGSDGVVHAIGDTCTHGDISLSEGFVEDGAIECWAHGSLFSLDTGKPLSLPAYEPVPVFVVKIDDDGGVHIDPEETIAIEG
ncbi:MAG: non-heme iron oxygenase ferredoxin subunit [Rhodoglobus sp.]